MDRRDKHDPPTSPVDASSWQFKTLVECAADGILVIDRDGVVLYVNPAGEALLGRTAAELLSSHFGEPIATGDASEMTILRKDGSLIAIEMRTNEITWEGEPAFVTSVRGISELKRLQAQVAQADRMASMGMLAAGIAHEINNPLAYTLYNLESVSKQLPDLSAAFARLLETAITHLGEKEWARWIGADRTLLDPALLNDMGSRLEDALSGSRQINEIAKGLGVFSRVEKEKLVPVTITHPIEIAINLSFNEIRHRARLVREFGSHASVLAIDGRLSQVFLNLLINAAHAIEPGNMERNEIRIRTWEEGGEVFTEIKDTGKGISQQELPHVLEPFFTTKEIGVGTGLGLQISQSIVEEYGGRIDLDSEVGSGTRAIVRLPTTESLPLSAEIPANGNTPSAKQSAQRVRILIVDDDAGIRSIMKRMLKAHDVTEAPSGSEAMQIIERGQEFDLILCDMMMPVMTGEELHKWIAETNPELAARVVFVTGGSFDPGATRYLSNLRNRQLSKPFNVAELMRVVSDHMPRANDHWTSPTTDDTSGL